MTTLLFEGQRAECRSPEILISLPSKCSRFPTFKIKEERDRERQREKY